MAIEYDFSVNGPLLVVETSGFDESLEEVQDYGMAVIDAAVQSRAELILCDERELEYRLGTTETYRAGEYVARMAPRVVRVALVCSQAACGDARFWGDVTTNRGLQTCVFTDVDEARAWLVSS